MDKDKTTRDGMETEPLREFRLTTVNGGGMFPGIDPSSNAQMLDIADEIEEYALRLRRETPSGS